MIPSENYRPLRPIEEVAADLGLDLQPCGEELRALCPRHADTNASLYVSPSKQTFYCHACAVGGNAISLARFLGADAAVAIDQEAKWKPVTTPDMLLPRPETLADKFCALGLLIRAGLVEPGLVRDVDTAAVLGDDIRLDFLIDLCYSRLGRR